MTSIFDCSPCDDKEDQVQGVDCIANLTLPVPPTTISGTRYIVKNVSGSIHPTWINLPAGLQEGDIIERDFQNLNWILDVDVSTCPFEGGGLIIWVECECINYWYDACIKEWKPISTCGFGGYELNQDLCIDFDGQVNFTLDKIVENLDRTIVKVNGQVQTYGRDYTFSGSTLIWLNNSYELETNDCLSILYC